MSPPGPLGAKLRWLLVSGAIVSSIPLYGLVVALVSGTRSEPVDPGAAGLLRPVLYLVALGAIAAGLSVMPRVPTGAPRSALSHPQAFAVTSMIALSLLETGAVVGVVLFFVGGRLADFLVLAAASLAGLLLHAVPQGLRYFAAQAADDGGAPPG